MSDRLGTQRLGQELGGLSQLGSSEVVFACGVVEVERLGLVGVGLEDTRAVDGERGNSQILVSGVVELGDIRGSPVVQLFVCVRISFIVARARGLQGLGARGDLSLAADVLGVGVGCFGLERPGGTRLERGRRLVHRAQGLGLGLRRDLGRLFTRQQGLSLRRAHTDRLLLRGDAEVQVSFLGMSREDEPAVPQPGQPDRQSERHDAEQHAGDQRQLARDEATRRVPHGPTGEGTQCTQEHSETDCGSDDA